MKSRAVATFSALALAAAFTLTSPARAQQPNAAARTLFEEGRGHSSAERWVEALDAFQRSRAIVERPATVFNIAAVLVRLGRAKEAMETVDRFLAISDARADVAMRRSADAVRLTAEASLRHVVLRIAPEGARVEIDGRPIDSAGTMRSMTLDPGAHAVAVTLDGYADARFTLEPGDDAREVTLQPRDGTLVVRSSVPTASITIDGQQAGVGSAERTVVPGPHEVALAAEGFVDFRRSVEIAPGERTVVDAALDAVLEDEGVLDSPLFWGLAAGGVGLVVIASIAIAILTAGTEPPYGGTANVVLAP